MNTSNRTSIALKAAVALLALTATALASDNEAPASLQEAFSKGKVSLKLRARYEGVEQPGLKDANAFTLRSVLGFTTASFVGFKAGVEGENVWSPKGDLYSQAGLNAGGTGRAVVADPESTELNQAWLSYDLKKTNVKAGRQALVLDNARFVGDVGWRQNNQSFDAVVVQDKSTDKLALTYGYLDRINRVFSDKHTQGKWNSQSHLLNASWSKLKQGTLTGYAYLLDFNKVALNNSCATYGLSFAGATALDKQWKLTYRAEYARQADHKGSTLNYETDYHNLELGFAHKLGALSFGHEALGSDNGVGFKTPLATLHAFNGWADVFLNTPGAGLRDQYARLNLNLPAELKFATWYHRFDADAAGGKFGDEIDVSLGRKLAKNLNALVKYANFNRSSASFADVRKVWIQADWSW